jgi:hypothetical protein
MGSNCIHASLYAYTANISTCAFNIHFLRVVEVTKLLLVCVYCLYTRIEEMHRAVVVPHNEGGSMMPCSGNP